MKINPEDAVKDVGVGQNTKKTAKIANLFQRPAILLGSDGKMGHQAVAGRFVTQSFFYGG